MGIVESISSSGPSGRGRGGARNMKYMRLPSATMFFMTNFYTAGVGVAPSAPSPGSATDFMEFFLEVGKRSKLKKCRVLSTDLDTIP